MSLGALDCTEDVVQGSTGVVDTGANSKSELAVTLPLPLPPSPQPPLSIGSDLTVSGLTAPVEFEPERCEAAGSGADGSDAGDESGGVTLCGGETGGLPAELTALAAAAAAAAAATAATLWMAEWREAANDLKAEPSPPPAAADWWLPRCELRRGPAAELAGGRDDWLPTGGVGGPYGENRFCFNRSEMKVLP